MNATAEQVAVESDLDALERALCANATALNHAKVTLILLEQAWSPEMPLPLTMDAASAVLAHLAAAEADNEKAYAFLYRIKAAPGARA